MSERALANVNKQIDSWMVNERAESRVDQANNAYGRRVANEMVGKPFSEIESRIFNDAVSSPSVLTTGKIKPWIEKWEVLTVFSRKKITLFVVSVVIVLLLVAIAKLLPQKLEEARRAKNFCLAAGASQTFLCGKTRHEVRDFLGEPNRKDKADLHWRYDDPLPSLTGLAALDIFFSEKMDVLIMVFTTLRAAHFRQEWDHCIVIPQPVSQGMGVSL